MTEIVSSPLTEVTATLSVVDGQLLRAGREYRLLSGSMHYFRVHPQLWRDRLQRLAALGLNTVDTYVPWNFHEAIEGSPRFDQWRDVVGFLELAAEAGLDVLLRPSPYICAEWAGGGIPTWLSARTRLLRSSSPQFLDAVERWYDHLIPRLAPLQANNGGPVVAVQVENEYGSFGSDSRYLEQLRDALRARGITELLTTADGTEADMQQRGSVAGAIPTFTFGSGVARAAELLPAQTPFICGEMWGGWFDHWGENHHVRPAPSMLSTVDDILRRGGSFSLYMAHGGTNFGLWNGANHSDIFEPTVTSYDSDAPISEDGRVNEKFLALREALGKFRGVPLPPVPPPPRFLPEQEVALIPGLGLSAAVQKLPALATSPQPLSFEELGVEDGAVAYQAQVDLPANATLSLPRLHDRATVFIDGRRMATLQRDGQLSFELGEQVRGARLQLVVESLGRINYGARLGEHKGILDGVLVGRRFVHGWTHFALPTEGWNLAEEAELPAEDGIASAEIEVAVPADAWLAFPGGGRGWVWLNGFLLGRYWRVGPQETLYAPAPLWRPGRNHLQVLDFDHLGAAVQVRQAPRLGPPEFYIGT